MTQKPPQLINKKIYIEKKHHFLQHTEKPKNTKEAYTDESKSIGRKVGFAAVFTDITTRGVLPKEASIHPGKITAIKVALKEILYAVCTNFQSSMHPILNQIYDILAELQAQDKKIKLCKILTHMRIKGNKEQICQE